MVDVIIYMITLFPDTEIRTLSTSEIRNVKARSLLLRAFVCWTGLDGYCWGGGQSSSSSQPFLRAKCTHNRRVMAVSSLISSNRECCRSAMLSSNPIRGLVILVRSFRHFLNALQWSCSLVMFAAP